MALDEGDKAIVREIAFQVSDVVVGRFDKHLNDRFALQCANCPVKAKVETAEQKAQAVKDTVVTGWHMAASIGGCITGIGALVVTGWDKIKALVQCIAS